MIKLDKNGKISRLSPAERLNIIIKELAYSTIALVVLMLCIFKGAGFLGMPLSLSKSLVIASLFNTFKQYYIADYGLSFLVRWLFVAIPFIIIYLVISFAI